MMVAQTLSWPRSMTLTAATDNRHYLLLEAYSKK